MDYFNGPSDNRNNIDPFFGYLPPRYPQQPPAVSASEFNAYKRKVNRILVVMTVLVVFSCILFFAIIPGVLADKIADEITETAAQRAADKITQDVLDQYKRQYNLPEDYFDIGVYVATNSINSVVLIKCRTRSGSSTVAGTASGIVVSEDGYVITNAHVINTDSGSRYGDITATMYGSTTEYPLQYVAQDTSKDLALLKFKTSPEKLFPVTFGDSNAIQLGEEVVILGNAGGLGISLSKGVVSQLVKPIRSDSGWKIAGDVFQTDAAVNPGNSGGPIFNIMGECIGVVAAKIAEENVDNIGFAIASNFTVDWIRSLSGVNVNLQSAIY